MEILVTDDRSRLYIGGQWAVPSTGDRITVRSASTEEIIGSVPEAAPADVDAAVGAARRAFVDPTGWATWDPAGEQRSWNAWRMSTTLAPSRSSRR